MKQPMTYLIWTDNSPGVLLRIAVYFSRRKINIESLTVSATEVEGVSRFTVVIHVAPGLAATIGRQIERMIEVRRVFVFAEGDVIHREVALLRAKLSPEQERALERHYEAVRVIQRDPNGALLECMGTEEEVSRILTDLQALGLCEFVRSGRIAVTGSGDYEADVSRSLHELPAGATEGPGL